MSNLNPKHNYPTHRSTILPTPTTNTTTNPPTTPYTHHSTTNSTSLNPSSSSSSSSSTSSINRNRQYSHLHAQLAQLNAQMADMENLVGMTAVQAGCVRSLGAWWGARYACIDSLISLFFFVDLTSSLRHTS